MKILICLAIGVFTWPVVEYLLHRFLGHDLKLKTLFKKEHTRHHAETNYFAPLKYKLAAAVPVVSFSIFALNWITKDMTIAVTFTLGFVMMFSFYEYVHWSFHAKAPKSKFGLELRKHHLAHHFQSPKMNHGVTSMWMDKMFGTYLETKIVKVPRAVAMPWMFGPDKTTLDPKYANDFMIK